MYLTEPEGVRVMFPGPSCPDGHADVKSSQVKLFIYGEVHRTEGLSWLAPTPLLEDPI